MTEATPTTIEEAIELQALGMVSSASESGRSQTNMSISELTEAAQFLARKRAAGNSNFGMRMIKCIPPGGG